MHNWLIDQLVQQGVRRFCIAPGSRSAPLAAAAAHHPDAETMVHFDERGLGFYALGYAMGAKRPVAIIVTSGTSIGQLTPAVMEAHHSCLPLLLLTADRPFELRDCGANQATDQVKFFEGFTRWQVDLPPSGEESCVRSLAAQAVFAALSNPPGPVHLNCQCREPLYTPPEACKFGSPLPFSLPRLVLEKPIESPASRGLILIGRLLSSPDPILQLAKRLQWPVFADILSQARCTSSPEEIRHFDWLLEKTAPRPELILHFGDRFTSKKLFEWAKGVPSLHITPLPFLQDPERQHPYRIQSDIAPFCASFQASSDPSWLPEWRARDKEMGEQLASHFASSPFVEAHAMHVMSSLLPSDWALFLGNSMPIRDGDRFLFPSSCRGFYANRGLSGIDGNIATAAGLADGLGAHVLAVLGDQACLYDLNSLPLLKHRAVTLLIVNNFGGGIFSHLSASRPTYFETHFAAAHSWHFEKAASMFDLPYVRFEKALPYLPSSGIAELITQREENFRFLQGLREACSQVTA